MIKSKLTSTTRVISVPIQIRIYIISGFFGKKQSYRFNEAQTHYTQTLLLNVKNVCNTLMGPCTNVANWEGQILAHRRWTREITKRAENKKWRGTRNAIFNIL